VEESPPQASPVAISQQPKTDETGSRPSPAPLGVHQDDEQEDVQKLERSAPHT